MGVLIEKPDCRASSGPSENRGLCSNGQYFEKELPRDVRSELCELLTRLEPLQSVCLGMGPSKTFLNRSITLKAESENQEPLHWSMF